MLDVHTMLGRNSSTNPIARTICLLFFGLYSSIIPVLSFIMSVVSNTLERSVRGLITYQEFNLLVWFIFLSSVSLLTLKVNLRYLPNFFAYVMSGIRSTLFSIVRFPWRVVKGGLNIIKHGFFSVFSYIGGFFGRLGSSKKPAVKSPGKSKTK